MQLNCIKHLHGLRGWKSLITDTIPLKSDILWFSNLNLGNLKFKWLLFPCLTTSHNEMLKYLPAVLEIISVFPFLEKTFKVKKMKILDKLVSG